jgi:SAM-dependent methyltransferase
MQMWCPVYLGDGKHIVEVEVTGEKNAQSKGAQIILVGAESAELDTSSNRTITYNSRNDGNPYPDCFDHLIGLVNKDGLILDCGSGDRSHPDTRVINFEYSMFRSPDVFGDGHNLPFKDHSFDLILSQAVIEHLYDPFKAVSEIYRVLKPGGTVYAESAFIQPLHAVPYHFFNTTGWGLEHLFKEFDVETVEYCGQLSQTLKWFYDLTALREKGFGEKVDEVLSGVAELDAHITKEELSSFASYVTLLAQKPMVNQ